MTVYCNCQKPDRRSYYKADMTKMAYCHTCNKDIRDTEHGLARHTYHELYSERRCKICGEQKDHIIHAGAVPVTE